MALWRKEEDRRGPGLLAKFDPNAKPLPRPRHATYAPFRSPEWKIHSNIGHAKNAVAQHRWIIRYEYREGEGWVEVDRSDGDA